MTDRVTHTEVDWSILDEDGVMETAERVARRASRRINTHEFDDLLQDTYLLLGQRAAVYRQAIAEGEDGHGLLFYRLLMDVTDKVKAESGRRRRTESYEAMMERRANGSERG